jgi:hypothetical protein
MMNAERASRALIREGMNKAFLVAGCRHDMKVEAKLNAINAGPGLLSRPTIDFYWFTFVDNNQLVRQIRKSALSHSYILPSDHLSSWC